MSTDAMFWDKIAAKYARSPVADEDAYRRTLERVASYLSANQTVLELGCGTASTAITLSPHVQDYVATDLSQNMIDIGAQKALAAGVRNLKLTVAQPTSAPEGPFDVVMAFNLFHLVPDLGQALASVHARLPQGGLFISKTPCLADTQSGFKRAMMRGIIPLMQAAGKAPNTVHFLSVGAWQDLIVASGFDVIETGSYPDSPPNRLIVARRR